MKTQIISGYSGKSSYYILENLPRSWETIYKVYLSSKKENNRLSGILDYIKDKRLINSYKEFADSIGESSVGVNDLKKGRKKIGIKHVKAINKTYPYINTEFILHEEGNPFKDSFVIKYIDENNRLLYYDLDISKIKKNELEQQTNSSIIETVSTETNTFTQSSKHYDKIIQLQEELLKSKNEIIVLTNKVRDLEKSLNNKSN